MSECGGSLAQAGGGTLYLASDFEAGGSVTGAGAAWARIIASTDRTLCVDAADGHFSEELYYYLAVALVRLPPLRDRAGDLTPLVDALLERLSRENGVAPGWARQALSPAGRGALQRHRWPRNVRELESGLRRLLLWTEGETIGVDDVRAAILDAPSRERTGSAVLGRPVGDGFDLRAVLAEVAAHYIHRALVQAGGNKSRAAVLLGLKSYQTLDNWIRRYAVKTPGTVGWAPRGEPPRRASGP